MSKTSRNIIVISVVGLLVLFAVIYSVSKGNKVKVPEGTIGNTPGNLNNYGMVAESDGMVYFSNPYDSGALYSMTVEGNDIKKLCDMDVEYINVGGDYIYFYGEPKSANTGIESVVSNQAMYRVNKKGTTVTALTKDVSRNMVLYGNNIYYQHYTEKAGATLAKMDIVNHQSTELLSYMVNPACMYEGSLYYNGMYKDHHLYKFDTETETETMIWASDIWNPIYDGNYVYFMDVQNNYRLCRYSLDYNEVEILGNDRVDFFNVYKNVIYYQVSSKNSPGLWRMNTDGSDKVLIKEGVFKDISITSTYTYFYEYSLEIPMYRTPTFGVPNVEEFLAAREAAFKPEKKK